MWRGVEPSLSSRLTSTADEDGWSRRAARQSSCPCTAHWCNADVTPPPSAPAPTSAPAFSSACTTCTFPL